VIGYSGNIIIKLKNENPFTVFEVGSPPDAHTLVVISNLPIQLSPIVLIATLPGFILLIVLLKLLVFKFNILNTGCFISKLHFTS
jgi:hypothetical protein